VSTLLIEDEASAILVDGFFSRPSRSSLLLPIEPDARVIKGALAKLGGARVEGVFVAHAHYDHGLDSGWIAEHLEAHFYGSASAAQIARGAGVPEARIHTLTSGVPVKIGRFVVMPFATRHVASPLPLGGEIEQPLRPPVPFSWYRGGTNFTFLIKTPRQGVLVVPSAGGPPDGLHGHEADVVFLSIAQLGKQPFEHTEAVWAQTVRAVGAKQVVLIHWDDFTRPLAQAPKFLPAPLDDIPQAIEYLLALANRDGVLLQFHPLFTPVKVR
jgi:L-ascorbate metabolism protein UlaG (beta-lactamase superfamily)